MKVIRKIIEILIILVLLQSSRFILASHAADGDIFSGVDISKNGDGSIIATLSSDKSTLNITGSGEMKDWEYRGAPWYSYRDTLEEVTIGQGVTNVGKAAFAYCSRITNLKISDGVTNISDDAFSGCSGLKSIDIPNSVVSIGTRTFSGCSGLTSIEIPNSVTKTGTFAFYSCPNLQVLTINGYFSNSSFSSSTNLKKLIITKEAKEISTYLINGLSYLEQIEVDAENTSFKVIDGVLYNWDITEVIGCPVTKDGEIVIPNTVTKIRSIAFQNCGKFTKIIIPNSVTEVGTAAFNNCDSLIEVTIPDSIQNIPAEMFWQCNGLEKVTLNENIKSIGNSAFSGCTSLKTIDIPESVTSISYSSLSGCSSLICINVDSKNKSYISEDGVLFDKDKKSLITYPGGKENNIYHIPDSVTTIYSNAFIRCSNLVSVIIPDTVTSIQNPAFRGCKKLTSVWIPSGVTKIGWLTFYECSNLKAIYLPSGISNEGGKIVNNSEEITIYYENETDTIRSMQASDDYSKVNFVELELDLKSYTINGKFQIMKIQPETKVSTFKKDITTVKNNFKIYNNDGEELIDNDIVKTESILKLNELIIGTTIVTGDTNGDGYADIKDIMSINKHRLNKASLTNGYLTAGDVNNDGMADLKDILQINKYRLGKIKEL